MHSGVISKVQLYWFRQQYEMCGGKMRVFLEKISKYVFAKMQFIGGHLAAFTRKVITMCLIC